MSASPDPIPYVPPSGDVFFPLASNAHALVTGSPLGSVRARMKVSSLLYNRVLLEAGQMSIQAGPHGAQAWRHQTRPDAPARWQTPTGRNRGQAVPFSLSMAKETTPGVPAPGPYHQVLHSETSICWLPTLEPFQEELPPKCDWIVLGYPSGMAPEFEKLADRWKRSDDKNAALTRLVPEHFVRSRIVEHVSKDLALGASGGWDVSVDRYHGRVIGARFAGDATIQTKGVALPILVPRVGDLDWEDVAKIRRLKAIDRLRGVLREVEAEAFEVARTGGDLEQVMRSVFLAKVAAASKDVHGIRRVSALVLADLVVGAGAGYVTAGVTMLGPFGPLVGAAATTAAIGSLHVRNLVRERRQRSWLGVMGAISAAAG